MSEIRKDPFEPNPHSKLELKCDSRFLRTSSVRLEPNLLRNILPVSHTFLPYFRSLQTWVRVAPEVREDFLRGM
jgi:hypothetical protein